MQLDLETANGTLAYTEANAILQFTASKDNQWIYGSGSRIMYRCPATGGTCTSFITSPATQYFKGIGVRSDHTILAATEYGNNTIFQYAENGTYLGIFTVLPPDISYDMCRGMGIDSSDRVYCTSYSASGPVRRYLANGTLDTTWGTNGVVSWSYTTAVLPLASGMVLVTGNNGGVRRYTSVGVLDTSFGSSGTVTLPSTYGRGLALDSEGNFYVTFQNSSANTGYVYKYYSNFTMMGPGPFAEGATFKWAGNPVIVNVTIVQTSSTTSSTTSTSVCRIEEAHSP
jgi:hypothetical protein